LIGDNLQVSSDLPRRLGSAASADRATAQVLAAVRAGLDRVWTIDRRAAILAAPGRSPAPTDSVK
jgi:hypothetical protein